MATAIKTPATIREELRSELEWTRREFHALLESIPDSEWHKKAYNSNPLFASMKIGQALLHVSHYPKFTKRFVQCVRSGEGFANYPKIYFKLVTMIAPRLIKFVDDRETVARKYEESHAVALEALNDVGDNEWEKGARFYREYRTIKRIFQIHKEHFEEHQEEVLVALGRMKPSSRPSSH